MYSNVFPLLLIVLGIGATSWAIAGSEAEGTLEMLLANRCRALGSRPSGSRASSS